MLETYFSATYSQARSRFINAAAKAGAQIHTYPIGIESDGIESDLDTALDVAILGDENWRTIVISSGVHGVEGFFGSAVQLALLDRCSKASSRPAIRYVLIHAVNPYGFSHLRRVNEDNIDLNRNFLLSGEQYTGAPPGYADLDRFLNPLSAPSRFEPFRLKALWNIWRHGLQTLKQAVAGGQFDYPRGLFYGGRGPSKSARIVQDNCASWLAAAEQILHIDLHTGLGASGTYKLLLTEPPNSENYRWYAEVFGEGYVESNAQLDATAYAVTGSLGQWMQHRFSARNYRFMTAEFGTYDVIRVLGAIRADNRAHFYDAKSQGAPQWVKNEIVECFCPRDLSWRRHVLDAGISIVDQGTQALVSLGNDA
jgi:hypothetical protein